MFMSIMWYSGTRRRSALREKQKMAAAKAPAGCGAKRGIHTRRGGSGVQTRGQGSNGALANFREGFETRCVSFSDKESMERAFNGVFP